LNKIVYIYGLIDPRNNGIFYIGFTDNIKRRYLQHLNIHGKTRNSNIFKKNIINKILENGLIPRLEILDFCNKSYNNNLKMYEHEKLEIYYIKKYIEEGTRLTNLTEGGEGGKTKTKAVYMYSEDGLFLKKFSSVNEIANYFNCGASNISRAIEQKKRNSYKRNYFFFSEENASNFKFKKARINNIPIVQYSLNGEFIKEYKSQKEASLLLKIPQSNINKCLNKTRKMAGNFLWFYSSDISNIIEKYIPLHKHNQSILKYDLNNVFIEEYPSVKEAKIQNNFKSNAILSNLKNNTKTCGGFVFKYKN